MHKPFPPPPTLHKAMASVKDFVRPIASQSLIDEQALKLIGESPERVHELLCDLQREVADGMASCNFHPAPSSLRKCCPTTKKKNSASAPALYGVARAFVVVDLQAGVTWLIFG